MTGSTSADIVVTPNTRCTPILVDLSGNGFHLSNAADGVLFDIHANGHPQLIPWPVDGTKNAWLVLDRNGNGIIDDATELFGNLAPQPRSSNPNGFNALAQYDNPENGGNGDGIIDARDAIYSKLRLWVDRNRNGFSDPDELITLKDAGIDSIDLDYQLARRRDANGNVFRFRSRVDRAEASRVNKFCYDVFLVNTPKK